MKVARRVAGCTSRYASVSMKVGGHTWTASGACAATRLAATSPRVTKLTIALIFVSAVCDCIKDVAG